MLHDRIYMRNLIKQTQNQGVPVGCLGLEGGGSRGDGPRTGVSCLQLGSHLWSQHQGAQIMLDSMLGWGRGWWPESTGKLDKILLLLFGMPGRSRPSGPGSAMLW